MVKKLFIGVAGTHSTGKSTFCIELAEMLEGMDISVAIVPSFGKLAVSQKIPILKDHTFLSTMWFINKTINAQEKAASKSNVVLVDRPVIDAFAYWKAAINYRNAGVCSNEISTVRTIVESQSSIYNYLLATELDHTIKLGLGRDGDCEFRASVDMHLKQLLNDLQVPHTKLHPSNKQSLLADLTEKIIIQLRN